MADIVNATIKSAHLGYEGHSILTAMLSFAWPDHEQALPAYNLNGALCAPYIAGVLNAAGVDFWGKLPGTYVRLELEDGWRPVAFGHIVHDVWFDPKELAERIAKEPADG